MLHELNHEPIPHVRSDSPPDPPSIDFAFACDVSRWAGRQVEAGDVCVLLPTPTPARELLVEWQGHGHWQICDRLGPLSERELAKAFVSLWCAYERLEDKVESTQTALDTCGAHAALGHFEDHDDEESDR